jgi:thiol-disulfide isomerase/thioredoxin
MLQLASHAAGKEREDWLKSVVDAYFSAAVSAPENDTAALKGLQALPAQIAQAFPGSKVGAYAVTQEIQADYLRVLSKSGDDPAKAQLHLRDRLLRFAQEQPSSAEAPKAVMEAATICEQLNKRDDARKCYRYVAARYPGTPAARKAQGIEWRLGEGSAAVSLELPHVYATSARGDQPYDIKEARGKVVVVYFWTSATPEAHGDFAALKVLTDRYQFKGLEVVYVNLDDDPLAVRDFLSGKLTSGVHLHQKGGLESETAARFGIKALPEAFLVGKDGTLIKHSLRVGDLEREVSAQLAK